jgi:hypothetical protein
MPGRPSLIISTACDFTKIKRDARGWVVLSNDPIYDLIQQLASLNKGTDAAAFNAKAYDILAYIGSIAGTTAVTTNTTAGDALINDIFACLGIPTTTGQFTNALGASGLFAVRGSSTDAVVSRGSGVPRYGAQAVANWNASAGLGPNGRLVIYGYPRGITTFTNEPGLLTSGATGYELFTVPAVPQFVTPIIGGVCLTTIPANARLLHEHGGQDVILAPVTPAFCGPLTASAPNEAGSVFALARRISDWIAPKPLYAATMVLGGMGGSLGGLSPIGPVTTNVTTVQLSFQTPPSNGSINTPITPTIEVKAVTASPNSTPIDGLTITLTVIGNNGSFNILPGSNVAVTANGGVARFPLFQTDKAGGYTLTATGSFDGGATKTAAVTSNQFQVNGQSQ